MDGVYLSICAVQTHFGIANIIVIVCVCVFALLCALIT